MSFRDKCGKGNVLSLTRLMEEVEKYTRPNVEIIEQPARRVRFRYSSEHRGVGSLRGADATNSKIRINNHFGFDAIIVVSCVTKNTPYRVHPHGLFGPGTRNGLLVGRPTTNEFELSRIGIQRTKHNQIDQALLMRAQTRVPELKMCNTDLQIDPFGRGFDHARDINKEDINAVRLAFQVFVQNRHKIWEALAPVVSEPIFDNNVSFDPLQIVWVSKSSGTFAGGQTVAIELNEKVEPNIEVVFYEGYEAGQWKWQSTPPILAVHHNMLVFETPPYKATSLEDIDAFFV